MIDFDADPSEAAPRRRNTFFLWAMAALILLNSFALIRWIRADTLPLAWDEAVHTQNTFTYRDRLAAGDFAHLFYPVYFNYPPLYNLTMIPFLNVPSDVADVGACVNVLYLAALVIAVFLTGRFLLNAWAGLAAATLVGFYPLIVMMSRVTILDLALTAWVAWAFYALVRSENFSRPGWSGAFGALLGLGMLTKWTAFIYLAGPAIPALIVAARERNGRGVLAATAVGLVVMAPWYLINLVPMLTRVSEIKNNPPAGGLILSGLASVLWYPIGLFEELNLIFLLIFVVGLALSFGHEPLRRVLLWFFVSLVMFTLIHNRNTRYALPTLPAVALLSVSWVDSRRGFGFLATVALIFFALFQFAALPAVAVEEGGVRLAYFDPRPPRQEDWKHREIIEAVNKTRDPAAPFTEVTVVSNAPYFHSTTMNITLRQRGGDDHFSFRGVAKNRWLDFSEFILMKNGNLGQIYTTDAVRSDVDWLSHPPQWFKDSYREVGRWPLPDNSEAVLYHAEPQPRSVSENEFFHLSLGEASVPNVTASNVQIDALPIAATETARGKLATVEIRCSSITYQGIVVSSVDFRLDAPQINLPRYRDANEAQLLSLARLSVHGTIRADTIVNYARIKLKWLQDPTVSFDGDTVRVGGRVAGVPVEIAARLMVDADWLRPRLQRVALYGVPVPAILFRALTDRDVPLAPNREWPFRIDLGKFQGQGDMLTVGA